MPSLHNPLLISLPVLSSFCFMFSMPLLSLTLMFSVLVSHTGSSQIYILLLHSASPNTIRVGRVTHCFTLLPYCHNLLILFSDIYIPSFLKRIKVFPFWVSDLENYGILLSNGIFGRFLQQIKQIVCSAPYLILLHPALGPLWEVSRQKFKGGSISSFSELQLEIAEFSWNNVQVDGSLIITAENAMGSTTPNDNGEPILQYGLRCGRCKLHNVKVVNRGIDWNSKSNVYWRNDVNRFETCKIILQGNAEFEASNVTIEGNYVFEVPDGHKLKITPGNGGLGLSVNLEAMREEVMETGSWYWNYQLNGSHIHLQQIEVSEN